MEIDVFKKTIKVKLIGKRNDKIRMFQISINSFK